MRRTNREPLARMKAQEQLLRKQLLVAIGFLVAIVGICAVSFKTYSPSRKLALIEEKITHDEEKEIVANDIEALKAANEKLRKTVNSLKRELASEKARSMDTKQVEEKQSEAPVAVENEVAATAATSNK